VEGNKAAAVFFTLGLFTLAVGFLAWHFPSVSIPFGGVGIYWLVAGFALKYAGREVPDSAFILALVFGVVGVVYMLRTEEPGWSTRIKVDDVSKEIPYNLPHVRKKTRIG
jgi:hypothetical protein